MIPGMMLMAPADECEMIRMLLTAQLHDEGPCAIRFPRGSAEGVDMESCDRPIEPGRGRLLEDGKDVVLIAIGTMVGQALQASRILRERGVEATVVDARFIRPLDAALIGKATAGSAPVFVIEENAVVGGLGDAVSRSLSETVGAPPTARMGIEDAFVPHGTRSELLDEQGLSAERIADRIMASIAGKSRKRGGGSI
jgi:1-deoxy-D-xylulose-5-phosphate synthase